MAARYNAPMRAALLLLLAGCASTSPAAPLRSLAAHSVNFAAMPGPGPHRGVYLVGSADADLGLPERLEGRDGSARFLDGRGRAKVVGGTFHFTAALMEKDFQACVGKDARVVIRFANGRAGARLAMGAPLTGSLGDAYPVWK